MVTVAANAGNGTKKTHKESAVTTIETNTLKFSPFFRMDSIYTEYHVPRNFYGVELTGSVELACSTGVMALTMTVRVEVATPKMLVAT